MNLSQYSVSFIYTFLIIFCRVGCVMMFAPGIGETLINIRIRLLFSLVLSLVLLPVTFATKLLPMPNNAIELFLNISSEIVVGVFIGLFLKILVSVVTIFGFIISNSMGLSAATLVDPSQASQQGTLLGNFFTILLIVLIFAVGIDHAIINGIASSYKTFPILSYAEYSADYTQTIVRIVNEVWILSVKMASSFIIISLLINIGGGILSKLMPQLHIFFLIIPLQSLIGFLFLSITISTLMLWFIEKYTYHINNLFG